MNNPLISVVINADTRSGFQENNTTASGIFNGCVSEDFLTDGVRNKINFFKGFDCEFILFLDEHHKVPPKILDEIVELVDCVVLRKHTSEHSFNDHNYHNALSLARGKYVCHVDQDTACFTSFPEPINQMLAWLEDHKFISYPSHWTPNAVSDPSFGGRMWASTRFFMCKRETLKLDELRNCILEPEWGYAKYGDVARRVNWTEHYLTLINENSVYYPPIEENKYLVFSWATYNKWTLRRLNELPYEEVVNWVASRGGIQYPVDVNCE